MLTGVQQHAADRFTKSLLTLSDDALIDTYHQASEDHRVAQAEGSDNLVSAYTRMLASGTAMRDRFINAATSYGTREPARHPFPGGDRSPFGVSARIKKATVE
jgi:hypothetical protein